MAYFRFVVDFFFFNDTATTEIYTLSLHDALPNWRELLATFVDRMATRRAMIDKYLDGKLPRLEQIDFKTTKPRCSTRSNQRCISIRITRRRWRSNQRRS